LIYSGWVNDSGDDGSMFLAISPFAGSMFVVIYKRMMTDVEARLQIYA
jgi:hypothetical protein